MEELPKAGSLVLRGIARVSGWFGWLSGLVVAFVTFLVCVDVVGRYVFLKPVVWTTEVTLICQVLLAWGAAAYVLREEEHVKVTIISDRLSDRKKELLRVVTSIIGFVACVVFFWAAWIRTGRALSVAEKSETFAIPMAPVWIFVCVGIALFGLQFIYRLVKHAHHWRSLSGKADDKEAG